MGRHVLGALALAFTCGALAGCGETKEPAKPPPDMRKMMEEHQAKQREGMEQMKARGLDKPAPKDKEGPEGKGDKSKPPE